MSWISSDRQIRLYNGDCREVLKTLDSASVETCICDPPYSLNFMNKSWDQAVPGPEYWTEVFRVLKPGAHLIAFGGTRTFHRLFCAIEDSGFQIRDCLMWLYGSGFPKSQNVSIALDKHAGKIGHRGKAHNAYGSGKDFENRDLEAYKPMPEHKPITEAAQRFKGYGSALKPSWEPIVLAMKPVDGTFANNALEHGVSGINIDGCRIGTEERSFHGMAKSKPKLAGVFRDDNWIPKEISRTVKGRWPANLLLDEESARQLDQQSGITRSSDNPRHNSDFKSVVKGFEKAHTTFGHKDTGGASRFFYTAKASQSERDEFNRHPTVKPLDLMRWLCRLTKTPEGGTVLDPFMGSGSTGIAAFCEQRKFIGIELERESYETAIMRLRERSISADPESEDSDIEPPEAKQQRLF